MARAARWRAYTRTAIGDDVAGRMLRFTLSDDAALDTRRGWHSKYLNDFLRTVAETVAPPHGDREVVVAGSTRRVWELNLCSASQNYEFVCEVLQRRGTYWCGEPCGLVDALR